MGKDLQSLIIDLINKNLRDDGEYYFSDNPTSPAVKHGGTWEQLKDVFLLAAGDTYAAGSTGGSADAVVVQHSHNVEYGNPPGQLFVGGGPMSTSAAVQYGETLTQFVEVFTNSVGENSTGKNMPPYKAVYVWRKIS